MNITPGIGTIGAKSIETILLSLHTLDKYYDQDPGAQHKSTIYFASLRILKCSFIYYNLYADLALNPSILAYL